MLQELQVVQQVCLMQLTQLTQLKILHKLWISTILNSFANVSNSIGNRSAKSLREIGSIAQATASAANSITKLNASAFPTSNK